MTLEAMLAATGVTRLFGLGRRGTGPGPDADPAVVRTGRPSGGTCRVLWDEVPPSQAGSWPAGGTLLFLWPQLSGDRRLPGWAWRSSDPEDEYVPWWNLEDSKLSAALLRPCYSDLVAFLSDHGGPAQFEALPRVTAVREYLRRLDIGQRGRAASVTAGRNPVDDLAALVEGADESGRSACTVIFGFPDVAVLHARRDERCLWLWLAPAVREGFDRFREEAGDGNLFLRCGMDWFMTGNGMPAPGPPEAAPR